MNLSPSLILPAVFFSHSPLTFLPAPTHSVALILPQDKVVSMQFSQAPINCLLLTRSECGLWVRRRNYSLSYFQLTMAAASLDKPSLSRPQGWTKPVDNENQWTGPWGNPSRSWRITEGLGFPSLPPYLWTEGKALMSWAKKIKIKGNCKGVCRSVRAWIAWWKHIHPQHHCRDGDQSPGLVEFDCCVKCLNRLSFRSSCGCCFLCMFRVNT